MTLASVYAERFIREEPQYVVLRRITIVVCTLFLVFGGFAGYRAWVQVRSLDLLPSSTELRVGATVTVDAVSWARTYVAVKLELVQGAHAETIASRQIGSNAIPSLDPRWRRERFTVMLSRALLERYHDGDARLVATAVGRPQWLRLPPPTVRESRVKLRLTP